MGIACQSVSRWSSKFAPFPGYGYSSGDRRRSSSSSTNWSPLLENIGHQELLIANIKDPTEKDEFYERLNRCIELATAVGRDKRTRSRLLMSCYRSLVASQR